MAAAIENVIEPVLPSSTSRSRSRRVKLVSCIIRAEKLSALTEELNKLNLVGGMTVTDLRGAGHERAETSVFRGSKFTAAYLPKVKVELAVESEDVERVESLIAQFARTGEVGDGKIFIFSILDLMRVRTGERGASAL